jgi:hypothetical protein
MSEHAQGSESPTGDTSASPAGQQTTQDQGTGTAAPQQGGGESATVPSFRLREEAQKRRDAEARVKALEDELAKRPAGQDRQNGHTSEPATADEPPATLNPRERARWIVEQDARKLLEREFGMPLQDLKTLIATTKTTAEDYAQRTWRQGCERHRLDHENREVQEMVAGLVKGAGLKLEDAFARAGKLYGKTDAGQAAGASVETSSQTGTMSRERVVPRDRQHAQELAEKGITIEQQSSHELIRAAVDKERERAGPQHIRTLQ